VAPAVRIASLDAQRRSAPGPPATTVSAAVI